MQKEIIQWLMHGENGASSIAIAHTALKKPHQKYSHPTTPKSFRQCLLIIEQIPETMQAIEELAKESKEWASILAHWEELEKTVRKEWGPLGSEVPEHEPKLSQTMIRQLLKQ